jgi:hypothetical protein
LDKVRNMELLTQPVLNEGLIFGKCGMTNIDLSCDWQGKTFVFIELKYGRTPLTRGQKYHLEGMVKAISDGGRYAMAMHAHHEAVKGEAIIARTAVVNSVYHGKDTGWEIINTPITVGEAMQAYYEAHLERNKR